MRDGFAEHRKTLHIDPLDPGQLPECLNEIVEAAAILLAAGFDGHEHGLDVATAPEALGSKAQLSQDHSESEAAFGGVVDGFDEQVIRKCPQVVALPRVSGAVRSTGVPDDTGGQQGSRNRQAQPTNPVENSGAATPQQRDK